MKLTLSITSVIILLSALSATAFAQKDPGKIRVADSTEVQRLITKDGSAIVGRIISVDLQTVQFEIGAKPGGNIVTIEIATIDKVETLSATKLRDGQYWFANPNSTRLFFGPTARTLKQGEGYVQNVWLFFMGGAVGVTDNFSLGGGLSIVPGLALDNQLFFLTPKLGFEVSPNANLGVGALLVKVDIKKAPTVGILYGTGSLGDENASITAGLGFGFVDSDLAESPMFMIGGEKRLSKRIAMVSENWKIPGETFVISYGLRFMGENLAVDLAMLNTIDFDATLGIPYLDFVFNF